MKLIVVSYANNHNKLSDNLEQSLEKYGYEYKLVGEGEKWVNFMTKIKGCYRFIRDNLNDDYIVIVCDAYDVLACGDSEVIMNKFLKFEKRIVVGTENKCGTNCVPLDYYYNYHDEKKKRYQYANGGFYMGYRQDILKMYKKFLDDNHPDDQISLCNYINKNPELFGVDSDGKLISNIQIYSYGDTIWKKNKVYNKYTHEYPCFIHTPAITFDMAYRLNYFGSRLLPNYNRLSNRDKISKLYNKTKTRPWIVFLIFLGLIIIFVLYKLAYEY